MTTSLMIEKDSWDLALDGSGNLASVEGKRRVAQDVATAVKLFTDEAIFAASRGIPYYDNTLGHKPPEQLIINQLKEMAELVPNVKKATPVIHEITETHPVKETPAEGVRFKGRVLSGEIIIEDDLDYSEPATATTTGLDDFYSLEDVYTTPNIYRIIL